MCKFFKDSMSLPAWQRGTFYTTGALGDLRRDLARNNDIFLKVPRVRVQYGVAPGPILVETTFFSRSSSAVDVLIACK